MAAEWYYLAQGKQVGPTELHMVQQMIAAGSLHAGDIVFGPGLTDWTPAGQVPALFSGGGGGGGAQSAAQALAGMSQSSHSDPYASPGMLGYRGVDNLPSGLSPTSLNLLRQTKPWVRFIAVIAFIGAGFLLLGGVAVAVIGAAMGSRFGSSLPAGFGLAYVAMGAIYLIPGIFLNRYASRIAELMRSNRLTDLEQALGAQKSFWKFMGILMIIGLCIYALVFLFLILGRASRL